MTACLRCDNCGAVASASDRIELWFRLERHGDEPVSEPGLPGARLAVGQAFASLQEITLDIHTGDVDDTDDDDDEMVELGAPDPPADAVHFCKVTCLRDWAAQAAMFEDQ